VSDPSTVPAADVTVVITSPITHRCPYADETDHGHIDLTWRCAGRTLELHSLRAWLDEWAVSVISHENLTDVILHILGTIEGIEDVTVTTRWATAGMNVTVTGGGSDPVLR